MSCSNLLEVYAIGCKTRMTVEHDQQLFVQPVVRLHRHSLRSSTLLRRTNAGAIGRDRIVDMDTIQVTLESLAAIACS
jgi:hypothetical protein